MYGYYWFLGLGTKIQKSEGEINQNLGIESSCEPMEGEKEEVESGSAFASDPLQEQHSHRRGHKMHG